MICLHICRHCLSLMYWGPNPIFLIFLNIAWFKWNPQPFILTSGSRKKVPSMYHLLAVLSNASCRSVANMRWRPGAVSDITLTSARKNPSGINGRKLPANRNILVSIFLNIFKKCLVTHVEFHI